jgi:hypothetical protein
MTGAGEARAELSCAIGDYPHIRALKTGAVASSLLKLAFADVAPINRAFAPMARELKYDVCEMAIATFLQAKACQETGASAYRHAGAFPGAGAALPRRRRNSRPCRSQGPTRRRARL